jgi:hypothetical protein
LKQKPGGASEHPRPSFLPSGRFGPRITTGKPEANVNWNDARFCFNKIGSSAFKPSHLVYGCFFGGGTRNDLTCFDASEKLTD